MDRHTPTDHSPAQPDVLAELVRAAGRRVAPPAEDYEYVLAAAGRSWQRAVRARRRRQWAGALAASLAVCTIGIAVYHFWTGFSSGTRPGEIAASADLVRGDVSLRRSDEATWQPLHAGEAIKNGARLRTGAAAGASLNLSDGGMLRLNAATELALVSGRRLHLVTGSAYIDSGERRVRDSLAVETDLGTVRDVGTVFEVKAAPRALRIRVREGRVRLDALVGRPVLEGQAGEELQVDGAGFTQRVVFPTAGPDWAWAEALAVSPTFDNQPLLRFLQWVAHETGRPLQFAEAGAEAQAANVVLHGSARDLKPLEALAVMLAVTDFEYALNEDGTILIRRRAAAH